MVELNNYLDDIRIPTQEDKVYKDESVYDYDTPVGYCIYVLHTCIAHLFVLNTKFGYQLITLTYEQESENGLYICLKTFYGVSKNFLELHHSLTKSRVYLNIERTRIEVNLFIHRYIV